MTFYDAAPTDWIGPGETATVEVDGWPVAIANVDGVIPRLPGAVPPPGDQAGRPPAWRRDASSPARSTAAATT